MRGLALSLAALLPLSLAACAASTPPPCPPQRETIALEDGRVGVTGWALIERLFLFPSKHRLVYNRDALAAVNGDDPTLVMEISVVGDQAIALTADEPDRNAPKASACTPDPEALLVPVDILLRAKNKSIPSQRFVGYARARPDSGTVDIEARSLRVELPKVTLPPASEAVRPSNVAWLRMSSTPAGEVSGHIELMFEGAPSLRLGELEQ